MYLSSVKRCKKCFACNMKTIYLSQLLTCLKESLIFLFKKKNNYLSFQMRDPKEILPGSTVALIEIHCSIPLFLRNSPTSVDKVEIKAHLKGEDWAEEEGWMRLPHQ